MAQTTAADDKRAQHVAAAGFWLQIVGYGALTAFAYRWDSSALGTVARLMLGGVPVWAVLYLIFKQARRVRAEQLETIELQRSRASGEGSAIFDLEDEELLIERDRLLWIVRWLLPATTVLVAAYFVLGNFIWWDWTLADAFNPAVDGGIKPAADPTLIMWPVILIGLVCFLFARTTTALSRFGDWRLLHGGATLMAANALACLALSIGLMAAPNIDWAEPGLCYLLRVAMVVLGIELLGNFVMDFYRPREAGIVSRPSFDSRLLGLITEPGGIAKSMAEAANYQFGFEVSATWFYQLMQRWLFPLTVATVVVILALTSVIIVDADEQVVVERFGTLQTEEPLDAGLHFKWPFPIEVVQRANSKSIAEIVLGEEKEADDHHAHEAELWTEEHKFLPEMMLLVASTKSGSENDNAKATADGDKSTPVSLLMVSIPIEYRIKDIRQYLYNYTEPDRLLESIAYQYLSDYASGVDVDELLGPGRAAFNARLHELIQTRLDELEVGIELAFVGVRAAHPPAKDKVAASFQAAVAAQIHRRALINFAEAAAREILTNAAGAETQALEIDKLLQERDTMQSSATPDAEQLAVTEKKIEQMLMGDAEAGVSRLSGSAAILIATARSDAAKTIAQAASKARSFGTEVVAYEAAPELYLQRRALDVYRGIDNVRKYVILGDPTGVLIEYDTQKEGGLDRVLAEDKE